MTQYGSVNPELLGMARASVARMEKAAFVPGGDPNMGGAPPAGGDPSQGGMPPGGDPSMGGAPPPGDPSMGGAPPPAPPAGGSDPTAGMGGNPADLGAMIQQQVQAAVQGMGGGGGAAGGAGGMKPKIDQNVVLLQILKILAKISDSLGIQIPASDMVVTPQDLQAMAQGGPGQAAVQSEQQAGNSAIQPIQPIQGASPETAKQGSDRNGVAFDTRGLERAMNKASAIQAMRKAK